MKKVCVVTGSSQGIGAAVVRRFMEDGGWTVYATMRTVGSAPADGARVVQLDVSSKDSIASAFDRIHSEVEHVDLLVNNAGYTLRGAIELLDIEQVKQNMETNVYGVIRCMQAVLPKMRARKSGCIVNIGSGSGRYVFPFAGSYCMTKFALEAVSEAAEYELRPLGVRVALVEPGGVQTACMANGVDTPMENTAYAPLFDTMRGKLKASAKPGVQASEVAEAVHRIAHDPKSPFRTTVGADIAERLADIKRLSDEEYRAQTRAAMGLE